MKTQTLSTIFALASGLHLVTATNVRLFMFLDFEALLIACRAGLVAGEALPPSNALPTQTTIVLTPRNLLDGRGQTFLLESSPAMTTSVSQVGLVPTRSENVTYLLGALFKASVLPVLHRAIREIALHGRLLRPVPLLPCLSPKCKFP